MVKFNFVEELVIPMVCWIQICFIPRIWKPLRKLQLHSFRIIYSFDVFGISKNVIKTTFCCNFIMVRFKDYIDKCVSQRHLLFFSTMSHLVCLDIFLNISTKKLNNTLFANKYLLYFIDNWTHNFLSYLSVTNGT